MRLAARTWGKEGHPLAVLVHGVSASSRTWWQVGPWFAQNGWRVVAVDLRGHGGSPRATKGLELTDLAGDVWETVAELLAPGEVIDVLLGHSLGALTASRLAADGSVPLRRLVLEDPPGPRSTNFGAVADGVKADAALAKVSPEESLRRQMAEHPAWRQEDATNNVASLAECDAEPIGDLVRNGLRYDLVGLLGTIEVPVLLVLAGEERNSPLVGSERADAAQMLSNGVVKEFATGHEVHRDAFERYVVLLGDWLGGPHSDL